VVWDGPTASSLNAGLVIWFNPFTPKLKHLRWKLNKKNKPMWSFVLQYVQNQTGLEERTA